MEIVVRAVVGKTFFQFSLFCCENVVSMLPIGDFYVRILNYVNFWIFATIALLIRAPTYFYKHVKVPTERRVRCLISLLHNSNGKWLQPFSVVLISLVYLEQVLGKTVDFLVFSILNLYTLYLQDSRAWCFLPPVHFATHWHQSKFLGKKVRIPTSNFGSKPDCTPIFSPLLSCK